MMNKINHRYVLSLEVSEEFAAFAETRFEKYGYQNAEEYLRTLCNDGIATEIGCRKSLEDAEAGEEAGDAQDQDFRTVYAAYLAAPECQEKAKALEEIKRLTEERTMQDVMVSIPEAYLQLVRFLVDKNLTVSVADHLTRVLETDFLNEAMKLSKLDTRYPFYRQVWERACIEQGYPELKNASVDMQDRIEF